MKRDVKLKKKIKINGNKFYMLNVKGEKWIYIDFKDGISDLIGFLVEKKVKPEDLSLIEVTMLKRTWKIKHVPWSEIAVLAIEIGRKLEHNSELPHRKQ